MLKATLFLLTVASTNAIIGNLFNNPIEFKQNLKGKKYDCAGGAQTDTIEWEYKKDADKWEGLADKTINIYLMRDVVGNKDKKIALLGQVQHPETRFTFSFPAEFPDEWRTSEDDGGHLHNNGEKYSVFFLLESVENTKLNSKNDVLGDPDFEVKCCKPGNNQCPCGGPNADQCFEPMGMCMDGKCSGPAGAPGEELGVCRAAPEEPCKDDLQCTDGLCKYVCTPGALNCPCIGNENASPPHSGGQCNEGGCTPNGICKQGGGDTTTIAVGTPCTKPGTRVAPEGDVCGKARNGEPSRLACVEQTPGMKTCQMCAPGTADCLCQDQACAAAGNGYVCFNGRCVPNTGCQNCPCESGVCNPPLTCVNQVCQMVAAPTPVPDPCAGKQGTENCPCAQTKDGKFGCLSKTLICTKGKCQNDAGRLVLSLALAALALVVAF